MRDIVLVFYIVVLARECFFTLNEPVFFFFLLLFNEACVYKMQGLYSAVHVWQLSSTHCLRAYWKSLLIILSLAIIGDVIKTSI